jgi:hypothetical protein
MARDAAFRLSALSPQRQKDILKAYEDLKNPLSVFREPCDFERLKALAGDAIMEFIVLEMDCIAFFPPYDIFVPYIQDYAVVINRRLFCRNLWFPVISLSSQYIRRSSDRAVAYALQHEFELSRIYQEISCRLGADARKEDGKRPAAKKPSITAEEILADERLIQGLFRTEPLLPQSYIERAMCLYLEANFSCVQRFGQRSCSAEEEAQGQEQVRESQSWEEFSEKSYEIYVREICSNLKEANQGYG